MKPADKICSVCGRAISWRKKWARDWPEVKYCSDACRRYSKRPRELDRQIEDSILGLLAARKRGDTICPSEVARMLDADDWSTLMEPVRRAARRLVAAERVQILQRGRVVDPSTARGPIRIGLKRR